MEQMIFYDETARHDPPQLGQMVSLGVVGPTRMDYPGAMAAVRAVAHYLSRRLSEE